MPVSVQLSRVMRRVFRVSLCVMLGVLLVSAKVGAASSQGGAIASPSPDQITIATADPLKAVHWAPPKPKPSANLSFNCYSAPNSAIPSFGHPMS